MYVVAKHQIKDAESFFRCRKSAAESAPDRVSLAGSSVPAETTPRRSASGKRNRSRRSRDYLDTLIGDSAENAYFQVSAEHAIGIPEPISRPGRRVMAQRVSFKTYSRDAAENYQRYFVPAIAAPLAADLVALAALQAGRARPRRRVRDRRGDEAGGPAGRRRGHGLSAVDVNPGMLAVARAKPPRIRRIEWREASADALPLPDEAFEVALCQLGPPVRPRTRPMAVRGRRTASSPLGGRLLI